jgi:hypothetical protein
MTAGASSPHGRSPLTPQPDSLTIEYPTKPLPRSPSALSLEGEEGSTTVNRGDATPLIIDHVHQIVDPWPFGRARTTHPHIHRTGPALVPFSCTTFPVIHQIAGHNPLDNLDNRPAGRWINPQWSLNSEPPSNKFLLLFVCCRTSPPCYMRPRLNQGRRARGMGERGLGVTQKLTQ